MRFSKKRARQNRQYLKEAKLFLEANPICMVESCNREATQIHHKAGRVGENLCDPSNFLSVCYTCHVKIELNPDWAKENGYSLSRLAV